MLAGELNQEMVRDLESVSTLHECFELMLTSACKEKSRNMFDIQVEIARQHKDNHSHTVSAIHILCGDDANCTHETLTAEWKLTESYKNMTFTSSSEELVEQVTGLCGYLAGEH